MSDPATTNPFADTSVFEAEMLQEVTCPECGRRVKVERRDGHWQRYGHRTTMPHTPETPWCDGGGRRV